MLGESKSDSVQAVGVSVEHEKSRQGENRHQGTTPAVMCKYQDLRHWAALTWASVRTGGGPFERFWLGLFRTQNFERVRTRSTFYVQTSTSKTYSDFCIPVEPRGIY